MKRLKKNKRKNEGNPQVEEGYTKISDEFLEALCQSKLLNASTRIVLAIIRYTWGFEKTKAYIKNKAIVELTQLDRCRVSRILKQLKDQNVVKNDNKTLEIGINKRFKEWNNEMLSKMTTRNVVKNDNKMLSKMTTRVVKNDNSLIYIDNLYKYNTNTLMKCFRNTACNLASTRKEKVGYFIKYYRLLLQREAGKKKVELLYKENECKLVAIVLVRFYRYHKKVEKEGWVKKRGKEFSKFYDVFEQLKTKKGYDAFVKETAGWNGAAKNNKSGPQTTTHVNKGAWTYPEVKE